MATSYTELATADILKTLDIIKENSGFVFTPDKTRVLSQDLSFAPDWKKIVCEDFSSLPYKKMHFLSDGNIVRQMQYVPDPYTTNNFADLGIQLNEKNVLAYLMFYYDYFLPSKERLHPVLHVDDLEWQDDLAPMTRQSLEKEFRSYPKISRAGDAFYVMAACLFRFAIMEVTFFIQADGQVTIKDSRVLIDDLPVKSFPKPIHKSLTF